MNLPKGHCTVKGSMVAITRSTNSEDKESEVFHEVCCRLSEGIKPGGYDKLKLKYGKHLAKLEEDLAKKWTVEAILEYERKIIQGLQKIGSWNKPKENPKIKGEVL